MNGPDSCVHCSHATGKSYPGAMGPMDEMRCCRCGKYGWRLSMNVTDADYGKALSACRAPERGGVSR